MSPVPICVDVCVLFFEFSCVSCPAFVSRVRYHIRAQCSCHMSPSMFMSRVVSFFFGFCCVSCPCPVSVSCVPRVCVSCSYVSVSVLHKHVRVRFRVCVCVQYPCSCPCLVNMIVFACQNSLRFEDHSILRPGPTLDPIGSQLIIIPDSVLLQSINNKQSFL